MTVCPTFKPFSDAALVVSTQWPEYRQIAAAEISTRMARRLVLDANRFTGDTLGAGPGIEYLSVGKAGAWKPWKPWKQ